MKMGGSTFIQIPVTPPGSVHGLDTERFIKPVRHWFDGLMVWLVFAGETISGTDERGVLCQFPVRPRGGLTRVPGTAFPPSAGGEREEGEPSDPAP